MTYRSLMVHLWLGQTNADLLAVTAGLAERFGAHVTGIAVSRPILAAYNNDGYVSADVIEQDRQTIETDVKAAEMELLRLLGGRAKSLALRSATSYDPLADYVASEARAADLIITGTNPALSGLDGQRHAEAGAIAMRAGRPVLIVPAAVKALALDRVVVGWKETRETRRAVMDAVPILKAAKQVSVVEVCAEDAVEPAGRRLEDVARWLAFHEVQAEPHIVSIKKGGDEATRLAAIAQDKGADLIVGGAYGHSRLQEWILGGVTQDLLLGTERCALVSH